MNPAIARAMRRLAQVRVSTGLTGAVVGGAEASRDVGPALIWDVGLWDVGLWYEGGLEPFVWDVSRWDDSEWPIEARPFQELRWDVGDWDGCRWGD